MFLGEKFSFGFRGHKAGYKTPMLVILRDPTIYSRAPKQVKQQVGLCGFSVQYSVD